jgi:hypothetical protein
MAVAAGLWLLAGAPVFAEFSDEWEAYAAETRAGCEAFQAALAPLEAAGPVLESPGDGFVWPRGTPGRPHVCLFFAFEVGADGKPSKVELLYRGPDNAHFRLVRAGAQAVKDRRYQPVNDAAKGVVRIDVRSEPGWRYRYSIIDLR